MDWNSDTIRSVKDMPSPTPDRDKLDSIALLWRLGTITDNQLCFAAREFGYKAHIQKEYNFLYFSPIGNH